MSRLRLGGTPYLSWSPRPLARELMLTGDFDKPVRDPVKKFEHDRTEFEFIVSEIMLHRCLLIFHFPNYPNREMLPSQRVQFWIVRDASFRFAFGSDTALQNVSRV